MNDKITNHSTAANVLTSDPNRSTKMNTLTSETNKNAEMNIQTFDYDKSNEMNTLTSDLLNRTSIEECLNTIKSGSLLSMYLDQHLTTKTL